MTRPEAESGAVSDDDYARLLAFRDGLRRFLHWSEDQARREGLTPSRHQLLLAIRGHPGPPSITDVAEHLALRHHSAAELVGRAEAAGLVRRVADADDHRVVRLALTAEGETRLAALAAAHLEELSRLRPRFDALWVDLPSQEPSTSR
ncbi:MarR family transcriptional regulator [Iamia sp. SCSIO 61187]|uniref:MarR family winged helix-turn-helix transcriptional regulator n=1 Tax=Iamia sp. SCSIO 61187 TaxID=2722752 RepID=UPI001C635CE9|nr:helix-turn-helix domain-containing protein [Iamia sp. SCSIO 61187]QYG94026.1 MarR family transcriptional regulator [Iamia sp. SCSIO 61187]